MDVVDYLLTVTFIVVTVFALYSDGASYLFAAVAVLLTYTVGYVDAWEVYRGG